MSKPRARFSAETNGRRNAVLWAINRAPIFHLTEAPQGLTLTEAAVLFAVESFVGWAQRNTGECWPSVEAIARAAKCSEASAHRALRELAGKGWLAIRRRSVEGASVTSIYRVTPPEPAADAPTDEPELH